MFGIRTSPPAAMLKLGVFSSVEDSVANKEIVVLDIIKKTISNDRVNFSLFSDFVWYFFVCISAPRQFATEVWYINAIGQNLPLVST